MPEVIPTRPVTPLYLSQADVVAVGLGVREVIGIVEETFRLKGRGEVECPPKTALHPAPGNFFHAMPACVPAHGAVGVKWIGYYPGNAEARGVPDSAGVLILNSLETGQPDCIMDGMWLSYTRTAAVTAVAARHLARPDARVLGLIGAGGLARTHLHALREVLPRLDRVLVFARRESSRRGYCEEMGPAFPGELVPVGSAREAVAQADVVVSSTTKPDAPFLRAEWVKPGALVTPLEGIAAWESAVLTAADRFLVDETRQAMLMIRARRSDAEIPEPYAELGDVVVGRKVGRAGPAERIVSINTGYAATDVTVGRAVYLRAVEKGLGTRLPLY
jgi:ornithine cyclodeaminase/alanine dehydrogenase-like protein (mu-crystallin family)